MKTKLLTINITALSGLTALVLFADGGGPLNPPAGPADGAYHTLGEIYSAIQQSDPRTPIRQNFHV